MADALPALVAQVAAQYGIPVGVGLAQINQESGFNAGAKSGAGAQGIAQFMPGTAQEYGVSDPYDAEDALQGWGKMMSKYIKQYGVAGALSAYNSGSPTAYKDPNFAGGQTYNYVKNILASAPGIAAHLGISLPGASMSSNSVTPLKLTPASSTAAQQLQAAIDYAKQENAANAQARSQNTRQAVLGALMGNEQAIAAGQSPSVLDTLLAIGEAKQENAAIPNVAVPKGGTEAPAPSHAAVSQPAHDEVASGVGGTLGKLIQGAKSFLGTPYVFGGNDPKTGIDCSRFVQLAFSKIGVQLPRDTTEQFALGHSVALPQIQPGDVVFVEPHQGPDGGPGHEGLYIGNGQVQESPHTGTVNKVVSLQDFLGDGLVGIRRYA